MHQPGKKPLVQHGNFRGNISPPWKLEGPSGQGFVDVSGYVPLTPNEHPRLLFRKGDLPELRRRAETPEGKAIVVRLRKLLDGDQGQKPPRLYSASKKAYDGKELKGAESDDATIGAGEGGAYTMTHVAGYGLLYQLTGDKRYAELGKQCFDKALSGVRDIDDRYSWKNLGGYLRAGPALGWYAIGYDLCYDGWDPDYRRKIAKEISNYEGDETTNLRALSMESRHGPGSNHFGPQVGGATLALLAVLGDDGADRAMVQNLLQSAESCVKRSMESGWSDHGLFREGDGPGCISSNTIYLPAVQALRVATGRDYVRPHSSAQWMTMKWVMSTTAPGHYPPTRGGYQHNVWNRTGLSGGGTFCQGFGAVLDEQKPALLWLYNHLYKKADDAAGAPCDTVAPYPDDVCSRWLTGPSA